VRISADVSLNVMKKEVGINNFKVVVGEDEFEEQLMRLAKSTWLLGEVRLDNDI
jgi:hypothetical protein